MLNYLIFTCLLTTDDKSLTMFTQKSPKPFSIIILVSLILQLHKVENVEKFSRLFKRNQDRVFHNLIKFIFIHTSKTSSKRKFTRLYVSLNGTVFIM